MTVRDREQLRNLAEVGHYSDHLAGAAVAIALVRPDARDEHQLRSIMWDLGRAAQNMVLVAWELGIGSVPATVYDLALASRLLGLPADRRCDFLLSFGYPANRRSDSAESGGRTRLARGDRPPRRLVAPGDATPAERARRSARGILPSYLRRRGTCLAIRARGHTHGRDSTSPERAERARHADLGAGDRWVRRRCSKPRRTRNGHSVRGGSRMAVTDLSVIGCAAADPADAGELTGAWQGNDNGVYYIRQVGDCVWWFGTEVDEIEPGKRASAGLRTSPAGAWSAPRSTWNGPTFPSGTP